MGEKDLVSVVIPTYNRSSTIERAVDSVLSQDYPCIEVVVVDDGSRDDTPERMLQRYGEEPRVRYVRQQNGGVCVARNRGLREIRGEFVAMLDSDDYWLPGKLRLQVGILKAHPEIGLIWSDMDAIDPEGRVVSPRHLRKMYSCYRFFSEPLDLFDTMHRTIGGSSYFLGEISQQMVLGNLIHTSTVVARSERLKKAGEYDQSVHPCEDQDYYYRVCKTGPVAHLDEVTIHYQIGADDAASGPSRSYEVARSSLIVFNRLVEKEGVDLRIPREIVEEVSFELDRWVGISSLYRGRLPEARTNLLRSLRARPGDRQSLKYLILTYLPFSHLRRIKHAFDKMRSSTSAKVGRL